MMLRRHALGLQRTVATRWSRAASASSFRSHTCGELRDDTYVGKRVTLSGWVDAIRPFGPLSFLSLRDRHGITQLVLEKSFLESADAIVSKLRPEAVIQVDGVVRLRPVNMRNVELATGAIEVVVDRIVSLNTCAPLPLQVARHTEGANEDTRLRHRYLDLRRSQLQQNLVVRSKVALATRTFLSGEDFLEIETPTLFKSTPEGAREFLVPTRTRGAFYALTQSPQQYKQLLMIGGLDRYFQLARCYRDEGGRADRQPEFTQIDLEMSFVTQYDVMDVIERLLRSVWDAVGKPLDNKPFPRLAYKDAMHRYGVDKPDTRFGIELTDMCDLLHGTTCAPFVPRETNDVVRAINCKRLAIDPFSRKDMDALVHTAKRLLAPTGAKTGSMAPHIVAVKVTANRQWHSRVANHLTPLEMDEMNDRLDAHDGDVLLFAIGTYASVTTLLGRMRTHVAQLLFARGELQTELSPTNFHLLWVVDFPMFEREEEKETDSEKKTHDNSTKAMHLSATHHPFTAPTAADATVLANLLTKANESSKSLLEDSEVVQQLLALTAQHYDIVCNGWELGGGSIRIHDAALQQAVFEDVLALPPRQRESFDHLLQALGHGAPPHGGIALGLDRLVAMLCGAASLRDVIAFPKSSTGNELMTNAPGPVLTEQLEEYHIQLLQQTTSTQGQEDDKDGKGDNDAV